MLKQFKSLSTKIYSRNLPIFLGGIILLALPFTLSGSRPPSLIDRILNDGFLRVFSSNSPTTYYEGPFGLTGFEYDLALAFAEELGVELIFENETDFGRMRQSIQEKGHLAAYGSVITQKMRDEFSLSLPYLTIDQSVIYKRGEERPTSIETLVNRDIVVLANSSQSELLHNLKHYFEQLTWRELDSNETLDLLELIHNNEAEITFLESTAYNVKRHIYPHARLAFLVNEANLYENQEKQLSIGKDQSLQIPNKIAWAFPKEQDGSLRQAANRFLLKAKSSGELAALVDKYYKDELLNEADALTLAAHIRQRLPKWESLFQEIANQFEMDWLLLAAISYQESHWREKARSYTGVRGLMMLTQTTAKHLGIKKRTDPRQSVYGGAKYFSQLKSRLSEKIPDPDRTWMALAAYNVGFGHLEDARILTQQRNGNPNQWDDVKKNLPLLAKKKYYKKTKHGYARGWEPVRYVENIRKFHRVLVWEHEFEQRKADREASPKILTN